MPFAIRAVVRIIHADLEQVGAGRVQQSIAHHCADGPGRNHRLGDKTVDRIKENALIDTGSGRDMLCRF
jgi:hypothetical protein